MTPASSPRSGVEADDIAIVGLACRFPGGASDEAKLWELLSHRRSAFTDVPADRFNADAYHHPSPTKLNTLNSRGAHFMQQDVAAFDAPFFGITAQEANAMDPAARMLLEVTFEAFENAGQRLEDVAGSDTSCYVGCFTRDYHEMLYRDIESAPMYTGTGTGFSLFSNRISWFYDLRGPSMTLDTACSSSLVGLHLACRGLQAGESKMAVVCGANVILSPDIALTLSNLHMLSMDGLSRSFAEGTTGYGRGEGISALVLKKVSDALRDGDPIRAVIRGTGVNQDGHTRGITVPNSEAQADLIQSVYSSKGLDPSSTGYFEAHGTGTAVGDPLELGAIAKAISKTRKSDNKLLVGSIKSNIGHLEGSAGLAGVIKCTLMAEKGLILPNIHFDKPNPRIPFEQWKISVPTKSMPWPNSSLRRSSVNSFGYGGTNAHVILDNAASYLRSLKPELPNGNHNYANGACTHRHRLFLLTARDEAALTRLKQTYREHLDGVVGDADSGDTFNEAQYLERLAYTLGSRRSTFACRLSVAATTLTELREGLGGKQLSVTKATDSPRLGFVFTGQGAQWAKMGLELMAYPVFARSVQDADRFLSQELHCTWSVLAELEKDASESQIESAEFSQPLSTILQVALVDLLSTWNILPAAVVGHSSGEIAAAYSYGAITREDAWKISYIRGQLCAQLPSRAPKLKGSMMAVGLGPDAVQPYLEAVQSGKVVIACINSPFSVTLSGDESGIDETLTALQSNNVFARKLRVMNAYHSHHMQILADDYLTAVHGMAPREPSRAAVMSSSVTGQLITYQDLGPSYWIQNLVSPVQFSAAVKSLLKQPVKGRRQNRTTESAFDYIVEIGPHSALKGPLRQILQAHSANQIQYTSLLTRGENAVRTTLAAAGDIFAHGTQINIKEINMISKAPSPLANLPRYPWNHTLKYWADSRISRARQHRKSGRHDLFGAPAQESDDLEPKWRHFLRVSDNPWIRDHVVHSSILYPGSGILAMPLHALQTLAEPGRYVESIQLRDVHITKAVIVPDDQFGLEVFLRMRRQRSGNDGPWSGWWEFSVCSNQENDNVEEHGRGLGRIVYGAEANAVGSTEKQVAADRFVRSMEEYSVADLVQLPPKTFYERANSVGLSYGPAFQGLAEINVGEGYCTWKAKVPDTRKIMPSGVASPHIIHPTTLDIVFHSLFAATGRQLERAAVPIGLDSLTISPDHRTGGDAVLKGFSTVSRDAHRDIVADVYVAAEQSDSPSVVVQGLRCRELPNDNAKTTAPDTIKAPIGEVVHKADIELLDAHSLASYLATQGPMNALGSEEEILEAVSRLDAALVAIIDLVAHKNPNFELVQVGAVNQILTGRILSTLGASDASRRFRSILFQDKASQLIDSLTMQNEELGVGVQFAHSEQLEFTQGDKTLDLIILGAHEMPESEATGLISSATTKLKPGGKLLVVGTAGHIEAYENLRLEVLTQGDTEASAESCILLMATQPVIGFEVPTLAIVLPTNSSPGAAEIADQIETLATEIGTPVHIVTWPEPLPDLESPPVIVSLLEYDASLLTNLSAVDYEALQSLVTAAQRLLWVSRGDDPVMQTATGFIRSLSNENIGIDYSFILLRDEDARSSVETAKMLHKLCSIAQLEKEYIETYGDTHRGVQSGLQGMVKTPPGVMTCSRWAYNQNLTGLAGADRSPSHAESLTLSDAPAALLLDNEDSQSRGELVFTASGQLLTSQLADNEVEIDVRCLVLSRNTRPEAAEQGWREAVGTVAAAGSTCTILLGTPVSFVYSGPVSTKVRVHSDHCCQLPRDVELESFALHGITLPAAYHLCTRASLQENKKVLVQGAGSVLGQMVVALSLELGATVWVAVGNEDEARILKEMGAPVTQFLSDNEFYRPTTLMNFTGNHGFDAIFNATGDEETISRLWQCMARGGKFVDASCNEASGRLNLCIKPFQLGASFEVVNMDDMLKSDFSLYKTIQEKAAWFFAKRQSTNGPNLTVFSSNKTYEALDFVANPANPAKALLLFHPDGTVPVSPEVKNQLRLRADATYVLAGGLGGLGRNLARLMVDAGAKFLVFLSRSGPGSATAQNIIQEFSHRFVTVRIYSCDVVDPESVSRVFAVVGSKLPPICGIIQSAAVLRDSIFENMSHSQWMEAIRPKVQGSWNLHQASLRSPCAEEGLDFFVMLASISGFVGNRGQANYAAGNSYQDALARYRRSLGLAATSVNLGLMQDIGLIAEQGGQSNLEDDTVVPLNAQDFNLIFKMVMSSNGHDVPAQIITGLPTGGILQEKGIATKPFYYRDRRFASMEAMGFDESLATGTDSNSVSIEEQLAAATSREQATAVVLSALREQVAKALRCPADDIDTAKSMHTYGMDSLMAVDMRNWVQTKLKAEISLFQIMSGSSIGVLAEKITMGSKLISVE